MSLADHFERTQEAGFSRTIDPETARRQFTFSLALVAVITIATLASALTLRVGPMDQPAAPKLLVQSPQVVHVQHASRETQRPGG